MDTNLTEFQIRQAHNWLRLKTPLDMCMANPALARCIRAVAEIRAKDKPVQKYTDLKMKAAAMAEGDE